MKEKIPIKFRYVMFREQLSKIIISGFDGYVSVNGKKHKIIRIERKINNY